MILLIRLVRCSSGRNERRLTITFLCVQPWGSPCTTCFSSHQLLVFNLLLVFLVFLFGAWWSIKTIFLISVLFTPVLNHPWMSTLWRIVASGRIILFQSCMPVQIILHQGHSDVRIMPTSSRVTFKVTLGAQACTFNKILPMHYMDEFFLLATHLNHAHVPCCANVWHL